MPLDLTGKESGNLTAADFLGPIGPHIPFNAPKPDVDNTPDPYEEALDRVVNVLQDAQELFSEQSRVDSEYVNRVINAYQMTRERTKEKEKKEAPLLKDAATNSAIQDALGEQIENLVGQMNPLIKLGEKGIKPGSIYTHDITVEKGLLSIVRVMTENNRELQNLVDLQSEANAQMLGMSDMEKLQRQEKRTNLREQAKLRDVLGDFEMQVDTTVQENLEQQANREFAPRAARAGFSGINESSDDMGPGSGGGGGYGYGGYGGGYGGYETFRESWRTSPVGAITDRLQPISNFVAPSFAPVQELIPEARNRQEMRIEMREIAFQTEGITGQMKEMQDSFYNIDQLSSSITSTGKRRADIERAYVSNLRSGFKTEKETLKITRSGLQLSTMIGSNAEQTASMFSEWHLQLGLASEQLDVISRGIQRTGTITNVTGDALLRSVQNAKPFLDAMRNAGTLTASAANNIIAMQANADKLGMGADFSDVFAGMSSFNNLMTRSSQETQNLLFTIANAGGTINDLNSGNILRDSDAMKRTAEGLRKTILEFSGGQLDIATMKTEDMDPTALRNLNLVTQGSFGKEVGQLQNLYTTMAKGMSNYSDKMAEIGKELQNQNLTLEERKRLQEQQNKITEDNRMDLIQQMSMSIKERGMEGGIAALSRNEDFRKNVDDFKQGGGVGVGGTALNDTQVFQKMLTDQYESVNRTLRDNSRSEDDKFIVDKAGDKIREAFRTNDAKTIRNLVENLEEGRKAAGVRTIAETDPAAAARNTLIDISARIETQVGKLVDMMTNLVGEVGLVGIAITGALGSFYLNYVRRFSRELLQPLMQHMGWMKPPASRLATDTARADSIAQAARARAVRNEEFLARGGYRGAVMRGMDRVKGRTANIADAVRRNVTPTSLKERTFDIARRMGGAPAEMTRRMTGGSRWADASWREAAGALGTGVRRQAARVVTPVAGMVQEITSGLTKVITPVTTEIKHQMFRAAGAMGADLPAWVGSSRRLGGKTIGRVAAKNRTFAEAGRAVMSGVKITGEPIVEFLNAKIINPISGFAKTRVGNPVGSFLQRQIVEPLKNIAETRIRQPIRNVVGLARSGELARGARRVVGGMMPERLRRPVMRAMRFPYETFVSPIAESFQKVSSQISSLASPVTTGFKNRINGVAASLNTIIRPVTTEFKHQMFRVAGALGADLPAWAGSTRRMGGRVMGRVFAGNQTVGNAARAVAQGVSRRGVRGTGIIAGRAIRDQAARIPGLINAGRARLQGNAFGKLIDNQITRSSAIVTKALASTNRLFQFVSEKTTQQMVRVGALGGVSGVPRFAGVSGTVGRVASRVGARSVGLPQAVTAAVRGIINNPRAVLRGVGQDIAGGTSAMAARVAARVERTAIGRATLGTGRMAVNAATRLGIGQGIATRAVGRGVVGLSGIGGRIGASAVGRMGTQIAARTGATAMGRGVTTLLGGPVGVAITGFVAAMEGVGNALKVGAQAATIFETSNEKLTISQKNAAEGAGFVVGTLDSLSFGILGLLAGQPAMDKMTNRIAHFLDNWSVLGTALQVVIVPLKAVYAVLWGVYEFLKGSFIGVWNGLKAVWEPISEVISEVGIVVGDALSPLKETFNAVFGGGEWGNWVQEIIKFGTTAGKFVGEVMHGAGILLAEGIRTVLPVIKGFVHVLGSGLKVVFETISPIILGVVKIFKGVIDVLTGVFTLDGGTFKKGLAGLWEGLWRVFGGIETFQAMMVRAVATMLSSLLKSIGSWFSSLGDRVGGFFGSILNGFGNLFKFVGGFFGNVANILGGVADLLAGIATLNGTKIWGGIKRVVGGVGKLLWDTLSGAVVLIGKAIIELPSMLWGVFSGLATSLWNTFSGLVSMVAKGLWALPGLIASGLMSLPSLIWKGITALPSMIIDALGRVNWTDLGVTIVNGIGTGMITIRDKALEWGNFIKDGIYAGIVGLVSIAKDAFAGLGNWLGKFLYEKTGGIVGWITEESRMQMAAGKANQAYADKKKQGLPGEAVAAARDAINYEYSNEKDFVKFNNNDIIKSDESYNKIIMSGGNEEQARAAQAKSLTQIQLEKRTNLQKANDLLKKSEKESKLAERIAAAPDDYWSFDIRKQFSPISEPTKQELLANQEMQRRQIRESVESGKIPDIMAKPATPVAPPQPPVPAVVPPPVPKTPTPVTSPMSRAGFITKPPVAPTGPDAARQRREMWLRSQGKNVNPGTNPPSVPVTPSPVNPENVRREEPAVAIPAPRVGEVSGVSPTDSFLQLHDAEGVKIKTASVQPAPLMDIHQRMQQEHAGSEPAKIHINNDALDRTADASDKQVDLLKDLIHSMKILISAVRPSGNNGGGSGKKPSTRSQINPPNTPNYGDWAFGVFSEVANKGVINDGSTT